MWWTVDNVAKGQVKKTPSGSGEISAICAPYFKA
jgi:hypothetical protein